MKLVELNIEALPGLSTPIHQPVPADRTSVIIGPNASGKSSLIRALEYLLNSGRSNEPIKLSAQFLDDQTSGGNADRIEIEAVYGRRQWFKNGQLCERPAFPSGDELHAYLIRADDLIDPGGSEQAITDEIKKLFSGGVDLAAVLKRPPFKHAPSPSAPGNKLLHVNVDIRQLEDHYLRIARQHDELDGLKQQREQAIQAEDTLRAIDTACKWLDDRQHIQQYNEALRSMPSGMDHLRGDEQEKLNQIDEDIEQARLDLRSAQTRLNHAQKQFDGLDITEPEAIRIELGVLRRRYQKIEQLESSMDSLAQKITGAKTELRLTGEKAGSLQPENISEISPQQLSEIYRLVSKHQSTEENINKLKLQIKDTYVPNRASEQQLAVGIDALRNWLQSPGQQVIKPALVLALCAVTTLIAGLLWWLIDPVWPAVAALVAAVMLLSHLPFTGRKSIQGDEFQQSFERTTLRPPRTWRRSDVTARLNALEDEMAKLKQLRLDQEHNQSLQKRIDHEHEINQANWQKLHDLADSFSFNAEELIKFDFLFSLEQAINWNKTHNQLRELEAEHEHLNAERRALMEQAGQSTILTPFSAEQALTTAALEQMIGVLEEKLETARKLVSDIQLHSKTIEQQKQIANRAQKKYQSFFSELGLDEGDLQALNQRMTCYPDYQQLLKDKNDRMASSRNCKQALGNYPNITDLVESGQENNLLALRSSLQEQAGQRNALHDRINQIEHTYNDALNQRKLEELNTQRERLRTELMSVKADHQLKAAGEFLIGRIEKEQQEINQPAMLKLARNLLKAFTRGRYELRFENERFSALDVEHNRERSLDQLSTGTRVQLKLALRLAWIQRIEETRLPLPVFLDEVLSTSDPDRYRAVVETVDQLQQQGRQVVYLSAQPVDGKAWQQYSALQPEVMTLNAGQVQPDAPGFPSSFTPAEPLPCPDPELSPEQWAAAAGIPAINPWSGIANINLFHIMRDHLAMLNKLRTLGIATLVQLRSASNAPEGSSRTLLQQRMLGAEAWLNRWQQGQQKPVTAKEMMTGKATTEAFMQRLIELAERVQGNAQQLIERMKACDDEFKIPRFGKGRIESLEQWLDDRHYLDAPLATSSSDLIACIHEHTELEAEQAAELHRWLEAGLADNGPIETSHQETD